MKCSSIRSFFHFLEALALRPIAAPIFVRCPDHIAAVFAPFKLEESYLSSLHYIERHYKNEPLLYCLSPEEFDTEKEDLVLQYFETLSKPLIWVIPQSYPRLRFESQKSFFQIFLYEGSSSIQENNPPRLRELLLPSFTALPQRTTPELSEYLKIWLKAFVSEIALHNEQLSHRKTAIDALDIILATLPTPEQHYLFFRQIKWALYRYLRDLKKS